MKNRNIRYSKKRPKGRAHRIQLPKIPEQHNSPRPNVPVFQGVGHERPDRGWTGHNHILDCAHQQGPVAWMMRRCWAI